MKDNIVKVQVKTDDAASGNELDSYASRSNGSSTTGGPTPLSGVADSCDQSSKGHFAERETENVNRLKYLILIIFLKAAAGVSIMIFVISNHSDTEEMNTEFASASDRLSKAFHGIRSERISILASLAVAAIAHGVDHKRDWPFVSLSSYYQRAFTTRQNSGVLQVSIAHLVTQENRALWENYIVSNAADVDWIERSTYHQDQVGAAVFIKNYGKSFRGNLNISHAIKRQVLPSGAISPLEYDFKESYLPLWEMSPFLSFDEVNIDLFQDNDQRSVHSALCLAEGAIVIGDIKYHSPGGIDSPSSTTSTYAQLLSIDAGVEVEYLGDPMSDLFIPIFDSFEDDRVPTAVLVGFFNWGNLFKRVLPETTKGIDLVLRNTCSDPFTYQISGEDVIPRGKGDLHDPYFDGYEVITSRLEKGFTADGTKTGLGFVDRECSYYLSIYPSQVFADEFKTSTPWILVSGVGAVLLLGISLFFVYDHLVERRQSVILRKAVQSTAIVSSLFPKMIRDRMLSATLAPGDEGQARTISAFRDRLRSRTSGALSAMDNLNLEKKVKATTYDYAETIADLFPNCTVLFADISGFTAWSSTRDPSQVFILLQNLYQAFDKVATKRRVFKVETIGDTYVAVTGLPEPQEAHALIMAKFSRDCLQKMHEIMTVLEVRLGPDTCDLSMRFGLNSGQVTGGVLKGDRARFQLFGDTVNTAARMESTGERGRIQLSHSTAELLIAAGKESWLIPRDDTVTVKGKGVMRTYWLEMNRQGAELNGSRTNSFEVNCRIDPTFNSSELMSATITTSQQESRLIGWMTEVLLDYVKQIIARNNAARSGATSGPIVYRHKPGTISLDELVESFSLSKKNTPQVTTALEQYRTIDLNPLVAQELRKYVAEISSRYHENNPFHNFAHACHVTMSVHKLMKRVVSDGADESGLANENQHVATYGILTSDPLTLFAIVFSGLIHDVDHRGVSNMQLSKEQPELAAQYRFKCIAEQNSFDVAWDLLMSTAFDTLRQAIFSTETDLMRFRQVVVNTVLATDIFDKEMGDMRKSRWDRVFGAAVGNLSDVVKNTRATIVLEHIIQASDVSHTMQHWHVYTKWNRRLFEEMHLAFTQGRMAKDPLTFWYEGELGFFDNYVIPLAKKLQQCRVFGVSSDEYLNYALSNRLEWKTKGQSIVAEIANTIQEAGLNIYPHYKRCE